MRLPILDVLPKLFPLIRTALKRKAVQGAVGTALAGGVAKIVGTHIVTAENIVPVIDAIANLMIALGTAVALMRGRNVTLNRDRDRTPATDG